MDAKPDRLTAGPAPRGPSIQAAIEEAMRRPGDAGAGLPTFDEARADFTRAYLRRVLELAGGNVSRAARMAGRNRTDLYKLLRRHGVAVADLRGAPRRPDDA